MKLFSQLSSENVKEVSLVYDMSDYFRIKRKLEEAKVIRSRESLILKTSTFLFKRN